MSQVFLLFDMHIIRYSFSMVAFCYCVSFAFDKAETAYSFSANLLNLAFMIPNLIVSIGSQSMRPSPPCPSSPPSFPSCCSCSSL
jgi:hypothetical protein